MSTATYFVLDATFLILALSAGLFVFSREVKRRRLMSGSDLTRLCAITGPVGFLSALLGGALDRSPFPRVESWSDLLLRSGSSSWAGILGATVVGVILLRIHRKSVLSVLDALAPAILAAYAIGRIGCHVTGDGCYGVETALPWGCTYPNGFRPTLRAVHPTELYESSAALVILLAVIWPLRRRPAPPGWLFGLYLVLHWGARFALEFIRLNPRHAALSSAQWFAAAMIVLGVYLLAAPGTRRERASSVAGAGAPRRGGLELSMPGARSSKPVG
jgi:phosphatidylglycerol:prolipoprotein diacylglycerol transferase